METSNKKISYLVLFIVLVIIGAALLAMEGVDFVSLFVDYGTIATGSDLVAEETQFGKNLDVWFMLMLVAFLMIFIKKYEWGVALAVLLSAAASFVVYLGIMDFYFEAPWNQVLLIKAVVCAITLVIAIGVFLGTVKMWQYLLVGVGFAIFYAFLEWLIVGVPAVGIDPGFMIGESAAVDSGGSILVHMCAAYFGIGCALGIREKRAFDEPMYTTTHSVTFVWLASMLLWMLWPSFVCSQLPLEQVTWGTITCYMAGIGSVITAYLVCMYCQGKVNPLTYTYAMLCGPVAIGAPLLLVGPWGALLIGIIAGAVSALCFIYLQPVFCKKLGILDVMGVHNLHGVGGWMGAIFATIIILAGGGTGGTDAAIATIAMAVITCVLAIVAGAIMGVIMKFTRGEIDGFATDDVDFIKNEEPVEEAAPAAQ